MSHSENIKSLFCKTEKKTPCDFVSVISRYVLSLIVCIDVMCDAMLCRTCTWYETLDVKNKLVFSFSAILFSIPKEWVFTNLIVIVHDNNVVEVSVLCIILGWNIRHGYNEMLSGRNLTVFQIDKPNNIDLMSKRFVF